MDRPGDSQQPAPGSSQSKPVKEVPPRWKTLYLILYNFISAVLWSAVLGKILLIAATHGPWRVYFGTGEYVKWVQTLAALEVGHSLVGMEVTMENKMKQTEAHGKARFGTRAATDDYHASRISLPACPGHRA